MSYAGLATGAGAGRGLEELFARMRAEEQLANQGRAIDIDDFNSRSADAINRGKLTEDARQFDAQAPVRQAQVGSLNAGASENTANARLLGMRGDAMEQIPGMTGAGGVPGAQPGSPEALAGTNGRLKMALAGIPVDSVVGPVRAADNTDEDLDAYARKVGLPDRSALSYDQRMKALAGRPQTVISQQNLNIRSRESEGRQKMQDLRIKLAEAQLNQLPPEKRAFALAEFHNRIQNDIQSKQTWMQWLRGEDVADPSAQIETIYADIQGKYGTNGPNAGTPGNTGGTPAPGAVGGDDLDAELARRRAARRGPQQ